MGTIVRASQPSIERFWADAGDYLVIAANQWSARAPDLLQCVQWLIDESNDPASDYYATVDASKIQAEPTGGSHCNQACRDDFGTYGEVSLLWWDIFLRDNTSECPALIAILETDPPTWNAEYSSNFICGP